MNLTAIQEAIREAGFDGWLFYDFHNRDAIGSKILNLDFGKFTSRRWFYFIPALGDPVKLVHRVEPVKLDRLAGQVRFYLSWKELHQALKEILGMPKTVAMQYSPENNIPYISTADAGTVELIRNLGHRVVSSADLVQIFEAVINHEGYQSHLKASEKVYRIKDEAFQYIETNLKAGAGISEYDVQQFIVRRFGEEGMTCEGEYPIVGVNDHPANPHFEPTPENTRLIRHNDTILIDLWARMREEDAIWADITWCGFAGTEPPELYTQIFNIARNARDMGLVFIREKADNKEACFGWEVDDAVRRVICDAGYGHEFIHRTGHSIGREVHGNGVNIDNLETREERRLIPGLCFSIEPGIYLEGRMAVRTEIDVFLTPDGTPAVAGEAQKNLILMNL